jgi:hypothetical protein
VLRAASRADSKKGIGKRDDLPFQLVLFLHGKRPSRPYWRLQLSEVKAHSPLIGPDPMSMLTSSKDCAVSTKAVTYLAPLLLSVRARELLLQRGQPLMRLRPLQALQGLLRDFDFLLQYSNGRTLTHACCVKLPDCDQVRGVMKCCQVPQSTQDPLLISHKARPCSSFEADPVSRASIARLLRPGWFSSLANGFSFDSKATYICEEMSAWMDQTMRAFQGKVGHDLYNTDELSCRASPPPTRIGRSPPVPCR